MEMRLIPDPPLAWETRTVPVAAVAPVAVPLSPALRQSVARWGVQQPVHLTPDGAGGYQVIDGRRRVAAARACGIDLIPAVVISGGSPEARAALSLTLNATRAPNPVAEAEIVADLVQRGYSEPEIAAATGLPVPAVRKRLALARLPDALLAAVASGEVAVGVAEQVANLPRPEREAAVAHWRTTGRLRAADLRALRQAVVTDVAASLPLPAVNPEPVPPPPAALVDLARSFRAGGIDRVRWLAWAAAAWAAAEEGGA